VLADDLLSNSRVLDDDLEDLDDSAQLLLSDAATDTAQADAAADV
jgi:hypothetical protein